MNLKFNRNEIDWIDAKYLAKDIAKDLAGFWVTDNKTYCARKTQIGVAHYYFNETLLKWKLDYFCDYRNNDGFREDVGIVINTKNNNLKVIDNVLYIIENNMFKMELSIEDTITFFKTQDIDIGDINFQFLAMYVENKRPEVVYVGKNKFIVFNKDFIKEYDEFVNDL